MSKEESGESSKAAARKSRLRWITLGEAVALAALIISGLGLYNSWATSDEGPAEVVEQRASIPLSLRAQPQDDGRYLSFSPVEETHAIDSLTIKVKGEPIAVGSDGRLSASDVEAALGDVAEKGDGTQRVLVQIASRYIEPGKERRSSGSYVLSYRWEDGGLFGGSSLRLTGLSLA